MKKWIAIVGSPRKKRNTDLLVDILINELQDEDNIVDKFYLAEKNITTCNGCEYCIKSGKCLINDDVTDIINKIQESDGVILASPSHNYNITAQMKGFIDRTFCLNDYSNGWSSRVKPGKKGIIIGVCAGSSNEAMGYTIEGMNKTIEELGIEVIDRIEYYDTKNNPVSTNQNIRSYIKKRVTGYKGDITYEYRF
ncbi:MAG: flavodoxin family protein [Clostridium sp.]